MTLPTGDLLRALFGNMRDFRTGLTCAMDVLGGRTLATYDLAHLLANDPAYMDRTLKDVAKMTAMPRLRSRRPSATSGRRLRLRGLT
jgi:hypothetical protein